MLSSMAAMYKLPFHVDLDRSKDAVKRVISECCYAWDVNPLAIVYHCRKDGAAFDILQFHNNRRVAHFMSPGDV